MFDKILFGSRLREIRQLKQLSLQDVAITLDLHKATLSNIEKGHRSPSIEVSVLLANHFQISLDYLVGLSDNPERN